MAPLAPAPPTASPESESGRSASCCRLSGCHPPQLDLAARWTHPPAECPGLTFRESSPSTDIALLSDYIEIKVGVGEGLIQQSIMPPFLEQLLETITLH